MNEPLYHKTTLPNGLRVVTSAMPHTRSVALSIYVGAGSRYETPVQAGLAHFLEHLCFKGTERYPNAADISQAIDGIGGAINAATDRELTVFYCKVPEPHLGTAVDVLAQLVRHPLLDAAEFEKERKVVLEELAMVADSPNQQVDLLLDETLWPDQPLGRDVAGTNESVLALTRDMAADYVARQYVPNNMVVSAAGAITHDAVMAYISDAFDGWKRGVPGGWFPAVNGQRAPRAAAKFKTTEQAHISLAVRGLTMLHPDRYALSLLSVILGEGMSSRLSLELREARGLCYDVHSYASYFQDAGALTVYAGVDPANTDEALAAILNELSRLRDKPVGDDELGRAKELMKGRLLLRMEDTRVVSDWLGGQELLSGRIRTVDDVTELVDAVQSADVQRVAKDLFVTEQLNLAIVGPYRSPRRFEKLLTL
jgi:predicted Zn-dependent peptidase